MSYLNEKWYTDQTEEWRKLTIENGWAFTGPHKLDNNYVYLFMTKGNIEIRIKVIKTQTAKEIHTELLNICKSISTR